MLRTTAFMDLTAVADPDVQVMLGGGGGGSSASPENITNSTINVRI